MRRILVLAAIVFFSLGGIASAGSEGRAGYRDPSKIYVPPPRLHNSPLTQKGHGPILNDEQIAILTLMFGLAPLALYSPALYEEIMLELAHLAFDFDVQAAMSFNDNQPEQE